MPVGRLFKAQQSLYLTATQKVLLGVITNLCGSPSLVDGRIDLRNHEIAERSQGLFSSRQVARHLVALEGNCQLDIDYGPGTTVSVSASKVSYQGGTRLIGISCERTDSYLPLFDLRDDDGHGLTHAEILVLSHMLDRAAICARANLECMVVDNQQMGNLSKNLNLSDRTVRNAVNRLRELGAVSYTEERKKGSKVLRTMKFDQRSRRQVMAEDGQDAPIGVGRQFCEVMKVSYSAKCREIVEKKAVDKVLRNVDNKFTRKVKAMTPEQRAKHQISGTAYENIKGWAGTVSTYLGNKAPSDTLLTTAPLKLGREQLELVLQVDERALPKAAVPGVEKGAVSHNTYSGGPQNPGKKRQPTAGVFGKKSNNPPAADWKKKTLPRVYR